MKNLVATLLMFVVVMLMSAVALATNAPELTTSWMPKASKSACFTITKGRANVTTWTHTSSRLVSWKAFDSTGAAKTVKRYLSYSNYSNAAHTPVFMAGSSEGPVGVETPFQTWVFQNYTTGTTTTICVDKQ